MPPTVRTRTPAKATAAKAPAKRLPRGTTTTPPASRPQPAAASGPMEPVEYDGELVVFSFTQRLQQQGLLEHKPVEIGGRVFAFRATASTEDNAKLVGHMLKGEYRESVALMLVDPAQIDDVLAHLQLPFDTKLEGQLWGDFVTAISGVSLGEHSAS